MEVGDYALQGYPFVKYDAFLPCAPKGIMAERFQSFPVAVIFDRPYGLCMISLILPALTGDVNIHVF